MRMRIFAAAPSLEATALAGEITRSKTSVSSVEQILCRIFLIEGSYCSQNRLSFIKYTSSLSLSPKPHKSVGVAIAAATGAK